MKRFPDGARVAFIGDSITAMNFTLKRIIDFYKKNYPSSGIRFFNCGIAGGTAASALRYFDKDIMRHAPTHAVLATGVNDSERWHLALERGEQRYALLERAFESYKKNLTALVDRLLSLGISLTLCTPLPYDEHTVTEQKAFVGGYALLLGYADFVRTLARERGLELCDTFSYFARRIETDSCYSADHIHPNEHGFYHLARCILLHQGLEIGEEKPIPEYLNEWGDRISRLRTVFAAEYMIIKDQTLDDEGKIAFMRDKIERCDWGQAVFERFIRAYVADKPNEAQLYKEIDELYERDIL